MAYGEPGSYGGACDGCRTNINRDTGLGFSFKSLIAPVLKVGASFIPGASVIADPLIDAGSEAGFGGGDGGVPSPCPQPPLWAVAQVLSQMSSGELASLQQSLSNSDRPHASASNPGDVAYWVAGGKDCNTNASAHPDVAALASRIRAVIANSSIAGPGAVYPIEGGPTISPIVSSGGQWPPPAYVDPAPSQSTWDKIVGALEHAGSAGVNAAITSATGSAYGVLPPAQQRIVQGSVARSAWDEYKVPIVAGAGLLAVLLLRPRGGR